MLISRSNSVPVFWFVLVHGLTDLKKTLCLSVVIIRLQVHCRTDITTKQFSAHDHENKIVTGNSSTILIWSELGENEHICRLKTPPPTLQFARFSRALRPGLQLSFPFLTGDFHVLLVFLIRTANIAIKLLQIQLLFSPEGLLLIYVK